MKALAGFLAVLALAGCEADGRPSPLWGAAAEGFSRGYGNGPVAAPAPVAPTVQPQAYVAPAPLPVGAQAVWTGQSQHVQTVTGGMAWQCVYDYAGQQFTLLFDGMCPGTARVR